MSSKGVPPPSDGIGGGKGVPPPSDGIGGVKGGAVRFDRM